LVYLECFVWVVSGRRVLSTILSSLYQPTTTYYSLYQFSLSPTHHHSNSPSTPHSPSPSPHPSTACPSSISYGTRSSYSILSSVRCHWACLVIRRFHRVYEPRFCVRFRKMLRVIFGVVCSACQYLILIVSDAFLCS